MTDQTTAPSMLDPTEVVASFHADRRLAAEVARALSLSSSTVPCFALGRNEHTLRLRDALSLQGIVDDFAGPGTHWHGLPVISADALPLGALVVNCAMSIAPLSAAKRIRAINGVSTLSYADLCRAPDTGVALPRFVAEARTAWALDRRRYERVFDRLADAQSKAVWNRVMAYRLTADLSHMHGFSVRPREQYFEPLLGALTGSVFADCGGYDGDTTALFAERYPSYKRIYLFEPSPINMQRARARLTDANVRDVVLVKQGVSDAPGVLRFAADAGSACAVSSNGSEQIEVTTLDAAVREPLDLIKMDLEGWELAALKGAERHIRDHAPRLAIAVYHQAADFWRVPEQVLAVRSDYALYLRHYTEGWSETVMYFVPRGRLPEGS